MSGTGKMSRVESIIPHDPLRGGTASVNSFKFHSCEQTLPRIQTLWFPTACVPGRWTHDGREAAAAVRERRHIRS